MDKMLPRFLLLLLLYLTSCSDDQLTMFTKLSVNDTGIRFKNLLRETENFNVLNYGYFYNGGGVAVGDINNDGLPDIYFTGNLVASRLYLNRGNWQFDEIAESSGVSAAGLWNTGVAMADVNGDGFLDIYVCRSAATDPEKRRNLLFINNGDLTFSEQGFQYGLDDTGYSTQASFFDYDRDGDLDMYLLNHSVQEYAGFNKLIGQYKNRVNVDLGDKLFRNDDLKFNNVTYNSGIKNNVLGFGLGVTVSDFNQDGWMDIYVSNDYNEEDYLYLNQKNGTFKESAAASFGHVSHFSMGCDGADINNDMKPDLVTLDMMPEGNYRQKMSLGPENYEKYNQLIKYGFHSQTMRNMLQLNNGNGHFSEIGQLAGVSNTDWSWSALLADYDNDGWKDLYVTNGYMRNYLDMDFMNYAVSEQINSSQNKAEVVVTDLIEQMPSIVEENYMFKNNADLTFAKMNKHWGMDHAALSNGAAYADLDNDGDLDLVVNNINEEAHVYRNNTETITGNSYLKVRLKGRGLNTFGIGAKIVVHANGQSLFQEFVPVRGFQSSVDYELLFGLGNKVTMVDSISICWPDSSIQKLKNIRADQTIVLDQQEAGFLKNHQDRQPSMFSTKTDRLNVRFGHKENEYLDFKKDKLLPYGISTSGPKIAKADFNNDGLEDFYIGGAKDSPGQLFTQARGGFFEKHHSEAISRDAACEDTDGIWFDADGDKDPDLYVTSGGSAFDQDADELQDRLYLNVGSGKFEKSNGLPEMSTSTATVAVADVDNDGDMDIFLGGRLVPGKYPTFPRSYLLLNDGTGVFGDSTSKLSEELMYPGMVTDAKFVELNGDDYLDLVVVGDWMGVLVYLNDQGERFVKYASKGLEQTQGWWNTIHTNDFDNDGDFDLILGNFGKNNLYKPTPDRPVSLVYKDFDNNGAIDPLMYYYFGDQNHFAYSRDELLGQIVSLKKKFPDYRSFAEASPGDFFSAEQIQGADTLKAVMFESVFLQNNGNGDFTLNYLPVESQFAPIYAIQSTDVNGDGFLDIIMAGNQSMTRVSTGKYDANYGVVLLGNGKGGFASAKADKSGLKIQGDVRDIALFDISGSRYALFSQNSDSVLVYSINAPKPIN